MENDSKKTHEPGEKLAHAKHPIFGCMKGTLTIVPGTDLTAPLWLEEFNAAESEPK